MKYLESKGPMKIVYNVFFIYYDLHLVRLFYDLCFSASCLIIVSDVGKYIIFYFLLLLVIATSYKKKKKKNGKRH